MVALIFFSPIFKQYGTDMVSNLLSSVLSRQSTLIDLNENTYRKEKNVLDTIKKKIVTKFEKTVMTCIGIC